MKKILKAISAVAVAASLALSACFTAFAEGESDKVKVILNNPFGLDHTETQYVRGSEYILPEFEFEIPAELSGTEFLAWITYEFGGMEMKDFQFRLPGEPMILTDNISIMATFDDPEGTHSILYRCPVPENDKISFDNYVQDPEDNGKIEILALDDVTKLGEKYDEYPPKGYSFKGWKDQDGVPYVTGEILTLSKSLILTADFLKVCKLTYDGNNGDESTINTVELPEGEVIELGGCPYIAPDGMEFDYWDVNGAAYTANDKITLKEDTVIKAMWKPIGESEKYTVTFDPNNGLDEKLILTYKKGEILDLSECPFKAPDGMEFGCWDINGEMSPAGTKYTVNGNTVITAIWNRIGSDAEKFMVTFDANNGDEATESAFLADKGEIIELGECPYIAPDGMEFDYWDVNGVAYGTDGKFTVIENTVIKAMWKAIESTPGQSNQNPPTGSGVQVAPMAFAAIVLAGAAAAVKKIKK